MKSKIKAVVTVYYPNQEHLDNIKRNLEQVDELYICDNSPFSNQALFLGLANCTYVPLHRNLGLSAAFNYLLKDEGRGWAEDDWIVFFDQDSAAPLGHMEKLVRIYLHLRKAGIKVGCIGPVFYNTNRGKVEVPKVSRRLNKGEMIVGSMITSSMLCRYGDLKAIGFWNERIFLDMADWDVCWRFCQAGYACCMTKRTVLRHTVGEGEKRAGLLCLRVGKPFREYYQTRDCMVLLKAPYTPLRYKLRFLAMLTVRPCLHMLFLGEPEKRLYYIKKGIHDFRKGIYGEIQQDRYRGAVGSRRTRADEP